MKLVILTQVWENYAWQEDGTLGVGDEAYWKAKGGSEYVVKNFRGDATAVVMAVRDQVECDNDAYRESIVDWSIVDDSYLTEFERDQLEYEGQIMFPAKELDFA
jgi:endo-1,4-beta-mannosidase